MTAENIYDESEVKIMTVEESQKAAAKMLGIPLAEVQRAAE